MAIKLVVSADDDVPHLVIGLNREDVNSLIAGNVFTLPRGLAYNFTAESDIAMVFEETDAELARRFPPRLRPM